MKIRYATMSSPVGPIAVAWKGDTVLSLHMEEARNRTTWQTRYRSPAPVTRLAQELEKRFGAADLERAGDDARVVRALRKYFEGDCRAIDPIRVDPGGTPFQAQIWKRLRKIPAGRTTTYGDLATGAGAPKGARAAGGAVGSNPIPVIIPCHRVVGSDQRLTGFGGGLERKRWLLDHEGADYRITSP